MPILNHLQNVKQREFLDHSKKSFPFNLKFHGWFYRSIVNFSNVITDECNVKEKLAAKHKANIIMQSGTVYTYPVLLEQRYSDT